MNTKKMRDLLKNLDGCKNELETLKNEYARLNTNIHYNSVSMQVNGRELTLISTANSDNERGIAVRGREMILLGVKKVYSEWIEIRERDIQRLKDRILKEAKEQA